MLRISVGFLIAALLFLLIYALSSRKKRKKKKPRSFGRRLSGFLTAVCFICAAVFCVIYIKQQNIKLFNRLKTYEMPEQYTKTLQKSGAEQAYPLLPAGVFSQGGDLYFINTKNDAFRMNVGEEGEIVFNTVSNGTMSISGGKTLRAEVRENGDLILDGYFLYSKYDGQTLEYASKTIARNVRSCSLTSNSLFYITNDGGLYAMGFNEYGQLSDTTTKNKSEPVFIMDGVSNADVSDTHAMIIDKFGTLYACGDNSYSQLATKNAKSTTELIRIMQGVKDIKTGNYFTLVLAVNGELYSAGTNDLGQLGNGGEEFRAELVPIMTGVEKIEIKGNTCAALTYSGELYVWGDNAEHKAGSPEGSTLASATKICEDVYDFALTGSGVAVLDKQRDILLSNAEGSFDTVLSFSAEVPEQYREKTLSAAPDAPEVV